MRLPLPVRWSLWDIIHKNSVSIGYCAKIAGMCEEDFIRFLSLHGVGIFDRMTEEDLLRDIANA